MAKGNEILVIGGLGLALYALSTIDWNAVADIMNKVGILLFGGAVLWALSRMQ